MPQDKTVGSFTENPEAQAKGSGSGLKAIVEETLISFCDGSYKKVYAVGWKHSQWIHFTLGNGRVVRVNPFNVNYIESPE